MNEKSIERIQFILSFITFVLIFLAGTILGMYLSIEREDPPNMPDVINKRELSLIKYQESWHIVINKNYSDMHYNGVKGTGSMLPCISKDSILIKIDINESEINKGDIVVYSKNGDKTLIVHRIVEIRADSDGIYYIFKGDNNELKDSGKIRKEQIKSKVIGIIY